ncbi:DNA mismatch repair protein MutL [Haloferula helveola]|uniref:DNA mismatch repair protein MutL n=1 Tax=Haloferula helveola TaxID=490095 RepID=A0ABM7RBS9_9BACT|nr:DNA mismatch repair protein MutL [Haloferula helveola]
MPSIRILPDILASQVAAGEVVERPASVIKELVENSLDAGAGEVLVEIRKGGVALMRVTDDGCGMAKEDALLCLERHATSKLTDEAGLHQVRTLGFRGEAVPSIASVSRFRLVTRPASEIAGTEIRVEGGAVRDVRDAGCAPGSSFEVRDLFFNVPARRKFLRTETTESAHIEHQLRLHALAADGVRFRFRKDERDVFEMAAGMSRQDRVRWMLGTELGKQLVPLPEVEGRGLKVSGFVLPSLHARKGRRHQCVFLNGRPVEDAVISRGLVEGFRGGLPDGLHPAAWLWIEMDPQLVDVNVHPAKREIRLHRPHDLREAVAEAVRESLAPPVRQGVTPRPSAVAVSSIPSPVPAARSLPPVAIERVLPLEVSEAPEPENPAPSFRMIGELLGRYALLESEDGLVIFDPRAARERILYERWLGPVDASQSLETQTLLVPRVMEPGPREAELLLRHKEVFEEAGFELEDFGGGSIRIGSVPAFLGADHVEQLLLKVVEDLADGGTASSRFALESLAKVLARQAAIRENPGPTESRALLRQLFACELPYCAADGRPTLTEISLSELERRFGA